MSVGRTWLTAMGVVLAAATALAAQDGASWPMYRGARGDGISNETGWLASWPTWGPKLLWKARVGMGFSSVSIADGRLYTMGNRENRDTVFCLDAATGAEIWKFTYDARAEGYPGPRATPTVDLSGPDGLSGSPGGGRRVYAVSRQALLHCLDAGSGRVLWSQKLTETLRTAVPIHGYACSPVVFEGLLLLQAGASDGAVAALDKTDGRIVWKSGAGKAGYSTPVLYENHGTACIAMLMGDCLIGIEARTGRPLYTFPYPVMQQQAIVSPVVSDGRVFISAGYGAGAALVDVSGEPKAVWRTVEFSNQFSTSVLWKGYLYGFDGDNERKPRLKCCEFATGRLMWSKDGVTLGGLTLADGKLIVLSGTGALTVVEAAPDGYRQLAGAHVIHGVFWTSPVLCGGRLYCRSQDGCLYCLDLSARVSAGASQTGVLTLTFP